MKTKSIWVMALGVAALAPGLALTGCKQETAAPPAPAVSAAGQKSAAEKAVADRAAAEKAIAEKAIAGKVAADKAAAEKASSHAKAEASSLPTGLVEAKAEISRTMAQLDVTMARLEDLSTAKGDLDKPSESALAAIETLETEIHSLKKRGDDMRDRGAAYFEAWEKQLATMSTPEVVAMATKRRDELAAKYAEVLTAMQGSRAALDVFWSDLKTIRKAVDDDLTAETQKMLGPQVKAAKEKAATLKSRVESTSSMLDQVSLLYTKP